MHMSKSRSCLHLLSIAETQQQQAREDTLAPIESLCLSPKSILHARNISIEQVDVPLVHDAASAPSLTPTPPQLKEGTYRSIIDDEMGPVPGTRTAQDRIFDQQATRRHQTEFRRAQTDNLEQSNSASPRPGSFDLPDVEDSSDSDEDLDEATRRLKILAASASRYSSSSKRSSLGFSSTDPNLGSRSKLRSSPVQPTVSGLTSNRISSRASSSIAESPSGNARALRSEMDDSVHEMRRQRGQGFQMSSAASIELFLRLNHARQTLDLARRQASMFSPLDKAKMNVWQALDTLDELRDYESALFASWHQDSPLDPDLSLKEHAIQVAELCRINHPDHPWMALCGLIHGFGKLLAHPRWGSQPQWAVCGETYPLGCRFDTNIGGAQHFTANPDKRRRIYNTPLGIYSPQCGLENVFFSWNANEYLYLLLMLNETLLPPAALFMLRHQKFHTLKTTPSTSGYNALCSPENNSWLPLLSSFRALSTYRKVQLPRDQVLSPLQMQEYYSDLIAKYLGGDHGILRF